MADWSGFVDKLREIVPKDLQSEHLEKLSQGNFTLRAMYDHFQYLLKFPLKELYSMLPGTSAEVMPKGHEAERRGKMKRFMTMMDSMTNEELDSSNPKVFSESTMIASGSGRIVREVKEMLEEYTRLAKTI